MRNVLFRAQRQQRVVQEWQFFNQERLKEIQQIEVRVKRFELQPATQIEPCSCCMQWQARELERLKAANLTEDDPEVLHILPDDLRLEREKLLAEGFSQWRKSDMNVFIAACEKYGRKNTKAIARSMPPRVRSSTSQYAQAFWVRCCASFDDHFWWLKWPNT